jgi:hypothetical protein
MIHRRNCDRSSSWFIHHKKVSVHNLLDWSNHITMRGMKLPELLTVLINGSPIGTIDVADQRPMRILGSFNPAPEFEPYRQEFEAVIEIARQYDRVVANGNTDDVLWNCLMAAHSDIKRLNPTIAGVALAIDEFAIHPDWTVEITFDTLDGVFGQN